MDKFIWVFHSTVRMDHDLGKHTSYDERMLVNVSHIQKIEDYGNVCSLYFEDHQENVINWISVAHTIEELYEMIQGPAYAPGHTPKRKQWKGKDG